MIPDILKDEKKLESFTKYMERDRTRFGRFLNAVHELMERVRTFFEGLGFKARTPEEDLIRDAYIEMRRAYNRSAAEYRGQKRNGTVAGTVLVDKFGGIRRTNGENGRKNAKFSSVGAKNGRNNFFDYSKNDFSKQIDDFMKSERLRSMTQDDSFLIGGTPDVLIKSGFNALPVTLNKTHVEHALNGTKDFGHEIYVEVLKQLPEAIKKPVIVMVSDMNPNRAVIVLKITAKNGKKIYAPIEIDGTGRSNGSVVNSNAITSIFGKTNVENKIANALVQESQGKMSVYYWNKKEATTLLQRAGVQFPSALPQDGFVHSIREKGSPVNAKLENVTNSLQFKRWFGNWQNPSQARRINSLLLNTDGTPKVWYHQTEQEFDTFDLERNTNSESDSETPKGIYLKSSSNDIGLKGKIQMQFYVSARNILTFDSRAEASTWYDKNIPGYREAREKVDALNEKYQKKYDEQESKCDEYYYNNYDAFVRGEISEEEFTQKAEEGLDKILGEWKKADVELRKECKNILNSYFESGSYDGIYIKHDEGSLGRMTDALIVFDKRNVKSATDNIGTFDRRYENSRYSTVDTTKITLGMSDEERAEVLNNSSIRLAEYVGNGEISPAKVYNLKTTYGKQARKILLTLGEKFGIFDRQYYNKAVELTFNYSKSSLKESFNKQSRINKTVENLTGFEDFAKMLSVFDDVVNNAVPIEVHEDKYKGTQRETRELKHDYVLLSAFKDGDFIIPVELHIKEFDNNDGNRLYVNVTLGKVKIEEGEIATTPPAAQNERQTRIVPSPSTISVPQLIDELNNNLGNFFKYLPPSMLSEAQNVSRSTAVDDENYRLSVMRGEDVSETLKKKAENTAMLHKLYTPITYNGKEYLAVTTVEEFYDEGRKGVFRRAYNLKGIKIESADGRHEMKLSASPMSDTDSTVSISDLFGLVKTFDKEFRYNSVNPAFLNEDGTPKVVYHGTDAEFWTFSFENRGKNSEMLGVGYYFTDEKTSAERYGSRVIEAYLDVKKPASAEALTISRKEWGDFLDYAAENRDKYIDGVWKGILYPTVRSIPQKSQLKTLKNFAQSEERA